MLKPPLKVLVVDDEPAIRDVVSDFLELEDYDVRTAANGADALALVKREGYDLVLTDLEMPKMNGLALLRELALLKRPPLAIIMTGYATVENAVEAMRVGAHDYILKPFKVDDVLHTLRKAAERLHLERENLQLKQAVSLYEFSVAMNLALPIDKVLDIVLETMLEQMPLDVALIYVGGGDRPISLRKQKSRLASDLPRIASMPAWERFEKAFSEGESVLVGAEGAVKHFTISDEIVGLVGIPLRIRNRIIGGLVGVSVTPGQHVHEGERRLLSILAGRTAAAIDNATLYQDLQQTFTNTIEGLVNALEARDGYTAGHSQRVARWAEIIAVLAGLDTDHVARVRQAAVLHDIGKIGVDHTSLNKEGKLSADEWRDFKLHPEIGRRILEPLQFLGPIVSYVHSHHERFDGGGYPLGLKGEAIPLGARILSIADAFEVMSTDRAYRRRLSREKALDELRTCAGTQFDPRLVEVFLAYLARFADFREAMANPTIGTPDGKIVSALG